MLRSILLLSFAACIATSVQAERSERPTKTGPAMIFNNRQGSSRCACADRTARKSQACGTPDRREPDRVAYALNEALNNPIAPRYLDKNEAQCQEVVHLATEEGFDVRKLVPAPTNTPETRSLYHVRPVLCHGS